MCIRDSFDPVADPSTLPGVDISIGSNVAKLKSFRGSIGFGGTNFRSVMPGPAGLIEFVPMIDEITGGHLEKTLDKGLKSLKGAVRFAATSVRDAYANTLPIGYDLNLQ